MQFSSFLEGCTSYRMISVATIFTPGNDISIAFVLISFDNSNTRNGERQNMIYGSILNTSVSRIILRGIFCNSSDS